MKSILLHIHDDTGQEARLRAACDIVRANGGHLNCVQVTPLTQYISTDPFGGAYVMTDILGKLAEQEEAEHDRLEQRLTDESIPFDWVRFTGDAAKVIVRQARLADLVVLNCGIAASRGAAPLPLVADVATHCRAPVLAVPIEPRRFDPTGPALVAWNGSFEAANALRAARPLLRQASRVDIVTIEEETDEPPPTDARLYLSRYGIASNVHGRARSGHSVAQALTAAIGEFAPAYVVMGAYGHSRARELLLGSVTGNLLDAARVPLFLNH